MFVRAYLRASTDDQNAERARPALEAFAAEHGKLIAAYYVENESGAKASRPELLRLLKDARPGDVLLIEQVDRLTRLTRTDWDKLKGAIQSAGVRVVALDLPTSFLAMQSSSADDFMGRMLDAMNGMLLDVLAAVARKDYDDRRRRQAEGIAKAKADGVYRGRPADTERHARVQELKAAGFSLTKIAEHTGYSRSQVCRILAS
ncbi:DNA invertase Pin-like site-specific DNA recombinase [Plasticicumulans lactativorans]|uniref:DNA invertase Pin-like site-specific DNA recombinase n=1 Tax=Plasticicumulans lactativorans TaxID=1133106 RepID=A0A4R2L2D0_9GAMM|nr:recombinase family protein [Plasticicumulans lactativorans]TCO80483.1 DNA invertase Pin-like site-specific DNA recombinase [Plasticicumulans lactativorans]